MQAVTGRHGHSTLAFLLVPIIGAFLTALPVSWTYMSIRHGEEYDQSLISTIIILPLVVTGIVVIVQNSLAIKRMGSVDDMVGAVRFLLSDDASWVTGQILAVDGGQTFRL